MKKLHPGNVSVIIDHKFLAIASRDGAWTNAQLRILGVQMPPRSGWKRKLFGKRITIEQAQAVVTARDELTKAGEKSRRKKINRGRRHQEIREAWDFAERASDGDGAQAAIAAEILGCEPHEALELLAELE